MGRQSMNLIIAPNTVIDDRYVIKGDLGQGGMGSVYEAHQIGLERRVAIKFLHPTLINDEESRARFDREAVVLSTLTHQNLGTFYSYGLWQQMMPYIAMEFIEGKSLRNLLDEEFENETFSIARLDRLLNILMHVADAISFVHKQNVLHRDLKPTNIIVTTDGVAKVVDFGLAKILANDSKELQKLTQTGMLIGTAQYLSPEICKGEPADHRADIYSFGCILYECLTGQPPHIADNPIGLMSKHVNENVLPPSQISKTELPPEFDEIAMRALAKSPADRYNGMDTLKAELKEARLKLSSFTASPLVIPHARTTMSNKIKLTVILLCILVAGVAVATITLGQAGKSSKKQSSRTSILNRLSESQAHTFLSRIQRQVANGNSKGAVKDLKTMLASDFSKSTAKHKLNALGLVIQNPSISKSDALGLIDDIENLSAKITGSSKSAKESLYAAKYAISMAIPRAYEMHEFKREERLFHELDTVGQKIKDANGKMLIDINVELDRRKYFIASNQANLIPSTDAALRKQLSGGLKEDLNLVKANLLFFYDAIKLKNSEQASTEFKKSIQAIKAIDSTDFDLIRSMNLITPLCTEGQRLELVDALLGGVEHVRDGNDRNQHLIMLVMQVAPSGSAPSAKTLLNRIHHAVDTEEQNWPRMRLDFLTSLSYSYSGRDNQMFVKTLDEMRPDIEASKDSQKKLSWVESYASAAQADSQTRKSIDAKTVTFLRQIYLDSVKQIGTALNTDPGRFEKIVPLSDLIAAKEGLQDAAEFQREVRKILKEQGVYENAPDSQKLILLRIPGRYPSAPSQEEFLEIQKIAEETLDIETKCWALVTLNDTYQLTGDHKESIKCLDQVLRMNIPDGAGAKPWALHYRGLAYDRSGDFENGEKMLWRAMKTTRPSFDVVETFMHALISHYEKAGDSRLADKLRRASSDHAQFMSLKPKSLDK